MSERLYGQRDDEVLYSDVASWYEAEIEPFEPKGPGKIEFAEWTASPVSDLLPSAQTLVEDVLERYFDGSTDEFGYDVAADAGESPPIIKLFQTALDEWGKGIHYFMADRFVASHVLTFDAEGQPLVDGEPLYRKTVVEA